MTATTSNNGRVIRKSLAEQIDRLDGILDCLADGLNDAVAAAVKEATALAVKEAVRGVLSEVLTNPDFLERIRSTIVPPSQGMQPVGPQAQGPTSKERLHRLGNQVKAQLRNVCSSTLHTVKGMAARALERCRIVWHFKRQLLIALGVGSLVGVGVSFGGPYAAAVAGWLGGFMTTVAVQARMALKKLGASISEA